MKVERTYGWGIGERGAPDNMDEAPGSKEGVVVNKYNAVVGVTKGRAHGLHDRQSEPRK
jgi:hypothetical protein